MTSSANDASGLTPTELATAAGISHQISTLDWLGPLAPIALSPFFGIACLSFISIWGSDWLPGYNGLIASETLKQPAVFCTFAILALLTSIPRLTKVSKPFAQATDRLEAYSSIIILLVIRFMASSGDPVSETALGDTPLVTAGVMSFSADILLWCAAAINILVINAIKFFFEFLVWLTPVPSIDAIFEFCNKSLCAGLLAVYAFSPLLATVLNLGMFLVALVMFRWVSRQVRFYRTLVTEPLFGSLWRWLTGRRLNMGSRPYWLTAFPQATWNGLPAKSKLFVGKGERGLVVSAARWPFAPGVVSLPPDGIKMRFRPGWFCHYLEIVSVAGAGEASENICFVTPWRHVDEARELAKHFNIEWVEVIVEKRYENLRTEWA